MDVISTAEVPAKERFAFWREVSAEAWVPLEVRCEPHLEGGFGARAGFAGLGPVRMTLLTTTPISVHRTPSLIRRSDPEAFLVTCALRGSVTGEQDGRRADLRTGDLVLRDSSRPYTTRFAPGDSAARSLVLRFPRSSLPLPERGLRDLTGGRVRGDHGVGALASQFLLRLVRHMEELGPADTARLSTLTLDLLTAVFAHELDVHGALPPQSRRGALLAQIYAFVEDNLGDSQLTPGAIAAAHHISPRYLHRLFQDEGRTVGGWIRGRRLDRCRRDLADPWLAAHSISAIAARWGFSSPAHFSQAFRAAYDLSPAQFRRRHTTGHAR
ncbi:helix-turn-helix domain-containing protein [Actinomadura sp. KC345]|uniref:AraC-like ligand-binding domain-containing protein n=1 Tax=Actinomadura sp. KC345 TaxID=2530371 RepID=UPI0010527D56|nr:helix-turn-helix domain-containing protein [Actinomadura sp. KC345]TDC57501.1 helix-turn-helix domain-containing protein [Actinomadura sp. KC345]